MTWALQYAEHWPVSSGPPGSIVMNNSAVYAANVAIDDVLIVYATGVMEANSPTVGNSITVATPSGMTPIGSPARGALYNADDTAWYYGFHYAFWTWVTSIPTSITVSRSPTASSHRCGWMNFRNPSAIPRIYGDYHGYQGTPSGTFTGPSMEAADSSSTAIEMVVRFDVGTPIVAPTASAGFVGTSLGTGGKNDFLGGWVGHRNPLGFPGMQATPTFGMSPPGTNRWLSKSWFLGSGPEDHYWDLCINGADTGPSANSHIPVILTPSAPYPDPCGIC